PSPGPSFWNLPSAYRPALRISAPRFSLRFEYHHAVHPVCCPPSFHLTLYTYSPCLLPLCFPLYIFPASLLSARFIMATTSRRPVVKCSSFRSSSVYRFIR